METKELKIQIPEGYCIDESKSTFEKIVFKKKDSKPRSWEEYCKNFTGKIFFIDKYSTIGGVNNAYNSLDIEMDKNTLPSKELAKAFLAMMQLMSLRQAWIGDWEPEWNYKSIKWCICQVQYEFKVYDFTVSNKALSFPTKEMAEDFINCFKDLLNVAKPLI